jgi:hypothetical protein
MAVVLQPFTELIPSPFQAARRIPLRLGNQTYPGTVLGWVGHGMHPGTAGIEPIRLFRNRLHQLGTESVDESSLVPIHRDFNHLIALPACPRALLMR